MARYRPLFLVLAVLALAVLGVESLRPGPPRRVPLQRELPPIDHGQSDETLRSYLGASRDAWQQTDRILEVLDLEPGQTVLDVGAGSGYFAWKFSRAVGWRGRVVALDIDPGAIRFMEARLRDEPPPFRNVFVLQSAVYDLGLEPEVADLAFMCEAHFPFDPSDSHGSRESCLRSLAAALKPGGRLAVIEARQDPLRGKLSREDILRPFTGLGLELESFHDFLKREHFALFRKP